MDIMVDVSSPKEVMSKHGKSFYFASQIFTKEMMVKISKLYAFCRYVDDCADELEPKESKQQIERIEKFLNNEGDLPELASLVQSLNSYGVEKEQMKVLVSGALFDVRGSSIAEDADFFNYCYMVAGVVGQMMCPLIEVKEKSAQKNAIALGVGMQITNICRDILEDAQNGRIYLPQKVLDEKNLNLKDLKKEGKTPDSLKQIIKEYLEIADNYYKISYHGLAYIPFRPRFAILIAGEIYRSIGIKIRKKNFEVLSGRVYLNLAEKLWVSIKTLPKILSWYYWRSRSSQLSMHGCLLRRIN